MTVLSREQVIGFGAVVVVLAIAGLIVFFSSPEPLCSSCLENAKAGSLAIHEKSLELEEETLGLLEPSEIIEPRLASLKNQLLKSAKEDMDWILEKEKKYFSGVQGAGNSNESSGYFARQIGTHFIQSYLAQLNIETANSLETSTENSESTIERAEEAVEGISQTDILGENFLEEEFLKEAGISEQQVKEEFQNLMGEYAENLKKKFLVASNPAVRLVNAGKLLELKFLFDIYS